MKSPRNLNHAGSTHRAAWMAALAILTSMEVAAPGAGAQGQRIWFSFDQQPPGTPARIQFDQQSSGLSVSVVEVTIPGFWVTTRVGADSVTYHDIEIPGLPNLTQIGAPRLPVARCDIGVLTGAASATLGPQQVLEESTVPGIHAWPEPIEVQLHDGSPEQFARDSLIYASSGLWPPDPVNTAFAAEKMPGEIPYAAVSLNLVRWNPATDELQVAVHSRNTIVHSGPDTPQAETIPKTLSSVLSTTLVNWPVIAPYLPSDVVHYAGYYLFVYPRVFEANLQPLQDQKLARGFQVTDVVTDTTGPDCARIRAAIRSWYRGTPRKADHFCLLVGEFRDIPNCVSPPLYGDPDGVYTDDLYGTVDGDNLDKEIYVGRLSVDNPTDVKDEVRRILTYEDSPPPGSHFDHAVLVAHREDLDGTTIPIASFQETVRTAAYATPPAFITQYGNAAGVNNASLLGEINAGVGLVSYVGHSSSGAWAGWDLADDVFTGGTIFSLSNAPRTPVMWMYSCSAGFVKGEDCLGEDWIDDGANGGVAFYGATALVNAFSAGYLNACMFDEVFNLGNIVQGATCAAAEHREETKFAAGMAWRFLLLGDPQMSIHRRDPSYVYVSLPGIHHVPCAGGTCDEIWVGVYGPNAAPRPGALVGVWKPAANLPAGARPAAAGPSGATAAGEVLDNRYTESDGVARIPAPALNDGLLYYTVQLDDGTALRDSALVHDGVVSGVEPSIPARPVLRASPEVTGGPVTFILGQAAGAGTTLKLFDVSGRLVRSLALEAGDASVRWDGRNAAGTPVSAGVFWARLGVGSAGASCRVVVLR